MTINNLEEQKLSDFLELSKSIENILVAKNVRGMKTAQQFLTSGYCYRAAQSIIENKGKVLIATGFSVADTFETDGPVGAIALYSVLEKCGYEPILVCEHPLYNALKNDYHCFKLSVGYHEDHLIQSAVTLTELNPSLIISIERPGRTADGSYRNMKNENITEKCANFDDYFELAQCPTIAIGDGGNEIGMGNIATELACLDVTPSVTTANELVVADVSNWAAYGIIAFLSLVHQRDFLQEIKPQALLEYLSQKGSVDGVTRENTLTEDGLPAVIGEHVLQRIRQVCKFV